MRFDCSIRKMGINECPTPVGSAPSPSLRKALFFTNNLTVGKDICCLQNLQLHTVEQHLVDLKRIFWMERAFFIRSKPTQVNSLLICCVCQKGFAHEFHLSGREKVHAGEKPFA